MLEMKNLSRAYYIKDKGQKVKFQALEKFTLSVSDGEFVVIVGPSGCGKSTLLDILSGLYKSDTGSFNIDGAAVTGPALDRGFVMQNYALFPWRTIKKNIEFGLELKKIPKDERSQISKNFINLVGLSGFENRYPYELSGGMKQRVAIARALAYNPSVLLMDEPFAAVDAQTREHMQDELTRIWQSTQKTIIFITHSIEEAVLLADRVVVMTEHPGTIKEIINIDLPRPRNSALVRNSAEYAGAVSEIWNLLHSADASLDSSAL
ncbi:ABC transporter ATP-binding protein [Clostridia bacterium]|nr:ABC transporter ATP-binding protein [Clostridia bacterium]